MDSSAPLRHSASVSSRLSAIDVSQLDKINAIPNKSTNNVLLDGLCQEDQLYLDALLDEDSLDEDEEAPNLTDHGGSAWSPPMAGRPMMNKKRIKRIKPAYTITLSLEDISYIRPSWGISKGIKRIELNKDRKKKKVKSEKTNEKPQTVNKNSGNDQKAVAANQKDKKNPLLNTYYVSLAILVLILISLMVLSYFVDIRRHHEKMHRFRLEFAPKDRSFKIMKLEDGSLLENRAFKVNYGHGIPKNLKHDECSCEMYEAETRRYHRMASGSTSSDDFESELEDANKGGDCFACFDWSHRANLQVLVNSSTLSEHHDGMAQATSQPNLISLDEDQSITCYDIKWQSYDTLRTPLIDCFRINEGDQWFGLGDIQSPIWPLNKFDQLEPVPLASNLSTEFSFGPPASSPPPEPPIDQPSNLTPPESPLPNDKTTKATERLIFGSHVELQLLTSSGFFVGNLKTDFRPAIKISASKREICLSVSCSERCTRTWSRPDDLDRFRYRNNLLEYSICSASSLRVLVSRLVGERSRRFIPVNAISTGAPTSRQQVVESREQPISSLIERLEIGAGSSSGSSQKQEHKLLAHQPTPSPNLANGASSSHQTTSTSAMSPPQLPPKRQLDGLGLIERTIFVTSPEYIELLDGQTLRQHVDKIVKLNLKTSPILVLDTRWQLYLGSFRINSAYFPKAKLLFEILHNKGFKLVLTIKPFIDASIGVAGINQLLDSKRIVTSAPFGGYQHLFYGNQRLQQMDESLAFEQAHVLRRQSFFRFQNETIQLGKQRDHHSRTPYLFKCKESHDGHCVLIDLVDRQNRAWLIDLIKRSNFLTQEADGILLAGSHPDATEWDDNYRNATADVIDKLYYKENLFVLPQWTGNFNYIQLAPRRRDWNGLRTTVSSVLTLSMLGFSLVHPGSVWGDLKAVPDIMARANDAQSAGMFPASSSSNGGGGAGPSDLSKVEASAAEDEQRRADEELIVRWLQVAVFLPILQFNDLEPIDKYNLHEQVQNLVRLRKLFIVPEIKRHLPPTPLLHNNLYESSKGRSPSMGTRQLPALRLTWSNVLLSGGSGGAGSSGGGSSGFQSSQQQQESQEAEAVSQQFMIGPDILVAPVLNAGQRQKDIYLPVGIWHDELRQTNIRGGKWLRNYPIEFNEIAWFTRARR